MALSDNFRTNTATLEARAREAAAQEVDRANGIDQKAAGLMAAGLALLAAGVAFAAAIGSTHAGQGARILWTVLLMVTLVLVLIALGFAIAAVRPRVFRIVLHINELHKWPTVGYLNKDPTMVQGTLLRGSIAAVGEARRVNTRKASRLAVAFGFFAAAVVAIVVLASAVAIRMTESGSHTPRRSVHAAGHVGLQSRSIGGSARKHSLGH